MHCISRAFVTRIGLPATHRQYALTAKSGWTGKRLDLFFSSMTSTTTSPSYPHHSTSSRLQSSSTVAKSSASLSSPGRSWRPRTTGGLRRLPVVKPPVEHVARARKYIFRNVKADTTEKNARKRARKHGAETIDALVIALCVPLRETVDGYRYELRHLHPFERVVADLTTAARQKKDGLTLNNVLDEIHETRKMILQAGKDWISKIKNAETSREAGESMNEGVEALIDLYNQLAAPAVMNIMQFQRSLRSIPAVKVDSPAVVLVGSPNVGKSSIVRCVSSATPEVNNYPFTTRGMTLGHVEVFWSDDQQIAKAHVPGPQRKPGDLDTEVAIGKYAFSQLCQIMDSPGLLVRPDDERNEMELLTLAAMQHLPTAVCYVLDLSGAAGDNCSSVADQLELRRHVRARFPKRPWVDVVSKIDLGTVDGSLEELEQILIDEGRDPKSYIRLSIHEKIGIPELRMEILRMLGQVRVVLDAMATTEVEK